MAKFESDDTNFTAASAEASSTHPVQCGALKKGGLVVLKVRACVCTFLHMYICTCRCKHIMVL